MVANNNPYFIIPMVAGDKMVQAVGLAIEMAKQSYPHLVEELEHAEQIWRKDALSFIAAINILRFGLNHISAGTVDYTGGEEVRANLLKGRSSAKPEAHESLAHG